MTGTGLLEEHAEHEAAVEDLEIELLLEAAYRHSGYDFRDYTRATVARRLNALANTLGVPNISSLIPMLLHDEPLLPQLVSALSVTVTELFRDPNIYRELRQSVLPTLSTYAFFKIWHAGCATGEEAYSMAILLEEAGLYDRATIFGTDMNSASLAKAADGIYGLATMRDGQSNFVRSGGRGSFANYYHARYKAAQLSESLSRNMEFFVHNLVNGPALENMNLIMCRNVLMYFNRDLKDRVLEMFLDSLCHRGYLCLGAAETIDFSSLADRFEVVSAEHRLYRKL
ncbi:MAG: protein-glutamate O-methyltransferase CheR [Actinomycetia bacterium]|nr:protein-glutamate O-methyltransferase CheR [Actinomycetes bacterium]MCP4958164.1 protein-glutamate O-methyltransferase CheR [Actinomycetes bacterium]